VTLADRLAGGKVLHLKARVTHVRRGAVRHAFTYDVDHALLCPDVAIGPRLFSRNRFNLATVRERDHGGTRGAGRGSAWAREIFADAGLDLQRVTIALLTQPRFAGFWFAPVSFWLALRGNDLLAAIAEVNNTFGQRHSYLCARPGFAAIHPGDEINAAKVFHVSPFQQVAGTYRFRFDVGTERVGIVIRQNDGAEGVLATMSGRLTELRSAALVAAALRRPGGAIRTLALIHWHALMLWWKGARYRVLPPEPDNEVSR
jgi:DUF1365 family protein